jgi:fructose-1,6-bisphosphatase/inositol monophosphatase family enzyme
VQKTKLEVWFYGPTHFVAQATDMGMARLRPDSAWPMRRAMVSLDIDAVGRLVRDVAAEEIMPRWRKLAPADISEKSGPNDLVTIADKSAEIVLSRHLSSTYPGTWVAGEEAVSDDSSILDRLAGEDRVWVIDPIDGTRAFADGRETFAVMIALTQGASTIAAWIYHPVSGVLYCAEQGSGVHRIDAKGVRTRLTPAPPSELDRMGGIMSGNIAFGGHSVTRERKARHFASLERMSCPGHDYPRILEGRAHFCAFSRCMPWDHLPGTMLLTEAGWTCAKLDHSPYLASDLTGGVMSAPTADAWDAIWRVMAS